MIKDQIAFNDFIDYRFTLTEAQGPLMTAADGNQYIDFASGWNVTNLGWNHPEVNAAIADQATKNVYTPMAMSDPARAAYAKELTDALPEGIDAICRATGGTEAVEMAIKTARAATGRPTILGYTGSYHGQLFASMALGHSPEMTSGIGPLVPGVEQIDFPQTYRTDKPPEELLAESARQLEVRLERGDVAALICEAGIITGWGSAYVAPQGYLQSIREITQKYGTLMILDEVGTGFSRTGKLFGLEHEGVTPDLVTFAKAITNGGAPMGAVVGPSSLIAPTLGETNLTSTYGWTPLACAAASKTLEIHKRDRVWERAAWLGGHAMGLLRSELADHPNVGDIRGIGLEIGIDFVTDRCTKEGDPDLRERVVQDVLARGVNTNGNGSVIQLMPTLTTPLEILDDGLHRLITTIKQVA